MKKRLHLTLLLAFYGCLAVVANTAPSNGSEQAGVAVWGSALYIHSADTLLVRGNLFLFNAHVQGDGALLLQDTVSRTIVAHESSLPNLIIDNPDTVSLQGQLHIRVGLVLVRGVFDTRDASLTLSDSATVHLLPGSQWLKQDLATFWQPFLPLFPPGSQQGQGALAVSPPGLPTELPPLPARQLASCPDFSSPRLCPGWKNTSYPPPEADGNATA